jgi:hypothetical protein
MYIYIYIYIYIVNSKDQSSVSASLKLCNFRYLQATLLEQGNDKTAMKLIHYYTIQP